MRVFNKVLFGLEVIDRNSICVSDDLTFGHNRKTMAQEVKSLKVVHSH